MIQITEDIPRQGFELVGEQVGAILKLELENQVATKGLNDGLEVYHERSAPYDKSEGVMVNVLYDNSNYDNHTQANVHAPSIYNIDVYGSKRSVPGNRGDELSATLIKQYVGMCRYILSSTKYHRLLFPPGTIGGVYVDGIQMYDVENNQDARNIRMARLSLRVRIYEAQELWGAATLLGGDTTVKLSDTDKGFRYELTN